MQKTLLSSRGLKSGPYKKKMFALCVVNSSSITDSGSVSASGCGVFKRKNKENVLVACVENPSPPRGTGTTSAPVQDSGGGGVAHC